MRLRGQGRESTSREAKDLVVKGSEYKAGSEEEMGWG